MSGNVPERELYAMSLRRRNIIGSEYMADHLLRNVEE